MRQLILIGSFAAVLSAGFGGIASAAQHEDWIGSFTSSDFSPVPADITPRPHATALAPLEHVFVVPDSGNSDTMWQ